MISLKKEIATLGIANKEIDKETVLLRDVIHNLMERLWQPDDIIASPEDYNQFLHEILSAIHDRIIDSHNYSQMHIANVMRSLEEKDKGGL